jgi:DNA-binding NarL/FixJ family response regulator
LGNIRTVVVTMSPLLSDIIKQLLIHQTVLDVIAEFDTRDALEERLRNTAPNLILIGLRPGEGDGIGLSFLALVPAAKVIAFSSDGRHAYLHEMRAHRAALIEVSPQALIDAILGLDPRVGD